MLLDLRGNIGRGSDEQQIGAAGDLSQLPADVSGSQRLVLRAALDHVGGQPVEDRGERFVVGVLAEVDSGVSRVADQLRLEVVVALQLVMLGLRLDCGGR